MKMRGMEMERYNPLCPLLDAIRLHLLIYFIYICVSYPSHQISLQFPTEWKQVRNFWQLGRLGWFLGMSGYRKVVSDADHDGIYDVIGYLIKYCASFELKNAT